MHGNTAETRGNTAEIPREVKFLAIARAPELVYFHWNLVDVRTVGFAVSFRSCRAIQGEFLLLAMLRTRRYNLPLV